MTKKFLFSTMFSLFISISYGQKPLPQFDTYHKNIYAELFGSHILAGANFDMRLKKGKMDGIGLRAGIGGITLRSSTNNTRSTLGLVTFPLEFNNLVGKRRSAFVSGIGLLPIYATLSANGDLTDNEFVRAEGFTLAGGFLTMGYRFQPSNTGMMFQVNWNPLMLRGSGFRAGWISLGLGMGFK